VTAVLETRDVRVRFGGLDALSGVSIRVEEGTTLGVIGPNGAGKTTLLNVITGHVTPTSGQVWVFGRDVTGARPWNIARLGVARTFQVVKPFREMTVRQNVAVGAMFGAGRGTGAAEALARASDVLERLGLGGRADALPGQLSVADLRALELAKALAMRPRLLLADEVMAGLRPGEVDRAVETMRSLSAAGLTVVAVEHVMRGILAISDAMVVLDRGTLLAQGTPAEVVADPRVVEAYLGERYARRAQGARGAQGEGRA
jgi:branched-chain amino acid transport system ATP-binding protein